MTDHSLDRKTVVDLMMSSKNEQEWNANCDRVKAAYDGYPSWWYEAIVLSGVMLRTERRWSLNDN